MQWILRFRVYAIISLAVMLISAAVLFSVLRSVLPHATGYKNEVQQEISKQIGLPVEIDSIDAAINWFSPRLKLIDVVIYDESGDVQIFNFEEAFVELDVVASILRNELIVDNVGLIGTDISIEKLSDSEWTVQGLKFTSTGTSELPEQFLYMLKNSDYLLHDSNIHFKDHTGKKLNIDLLDVNIDVENNFNNHDMAVSVILPEAYGRNLTVVASVRGDLDALSGDVYVEGTQLNLKQWNKKFNLSDLYQVDATVDVDLWVSIDNDDIKTLYTQFESTDFSILNKATKVSWNTDFISSNIRYVFDDEHWNIAVTDFYFGEQSKPDWPRHTDLLVSDDDNYFYLSAEFLRYIDVQKMASVFRGKDKLVDFSLLKDYKIQSDIYNLNLRLPKDMSEQALIDTLYLDMDIIDFSVNDAANSIQLSGLDSSIHYEEQQFVFNVLSENTDIYLWELFRGPLSASLIKGELTIDHNDDDWHVMSEQIQLKNNHINTFSRLDIRFSSSDDVFTDVQTNFYDADASNAKHYLPVGVMSPGLVSWIDMAVTEGYVPNGEFILHGGIKDFPFDNGEGIFQVLFSPEKVKMRFLQDWPVLKNTSAKITFNNKSLIVEDASGQTLDAKLFNGNAAIADLTDPYLTVSLNAESEVEEMQSYIWNSPLDEVLGDAMRLFQFGGMGDLKLNIELPLNKEDTDVTIDGHLNFVNSEIYYPTLDYELTNLNGVIDFTKDSIFADAIRAKIKGDSVLINAMTKNGSSGREVVFNMDGVITADYLLQYYQWIPDKWFSGKSRWAIDVEVPYQPKDYLIRIKAGTEFENVAIQMSDKVNKPSSDKLEFATVINVLDGNGIHVDAVANHVTDSALVSEQDKKLDQKDLLALSASRDENNLWSFNVESEYIEGRGEFSERLDKDTYVRLTLDRVDLHALFVVSGSDDTNDIQPGEFPPLDFSAKEVLWDEMAFSDVRLATDWHEHGMQIDRFSLKAPSIIFDARGTWLTSWRGSHETVLEGEIKGDNIGNALTGLGFEKSIDLSKYKAEFNAIWSAQPYGLSWSNVKGKTVFEMKNGRIQEIEPGAGGRLLGLFNVFDLAKRLAFDFNDIIHKGFSFDSIDGEFEFVNGSGSLKKFDVSASAADIIMFGSIGLIDHDYGLLMRVKPHTDALTFAGAALLGGVAIGASVALIQKVFDLGVIGHNVYSITGSWDDPKVEKIVERKRGIEAELNEDDDF
jgi:uncharacterized protein YhdP